MVKAMFGREGPIEAGEKVETCLFQGLLELNSHPGGTFFCFFGYRIFTSPTLDEEKTGPYRLEVASAFRTTVSVVMDIDVSKVIDVLLGNSGRSQIVFTYLCDTLAVHSEEHAKMLEDAQSEPFDPKGFSPLPPVVLPISDRISTKRRVGAHLMVMAIQTASRGRFLGPNPSCGRRSKPARYHFLTPYKYPPGFVGNPMPAPGVRRKIYFDRVEISGMGD